MRFIDREWRRLLEGVLIPQEDEIKPPTGAEEVTEPGETEQNHGGEDTHQEMDHQSDQGTVEEESSEDSSEEGTAEEESSEDSSEEGTVEEENEEFSPFLGTQNTEQAVDLDQLIDHSQRRRLSHQFARIISKVAEDHVGEPTEGDDEWDVEEIMKRRYTGRPLLSCRCSREKQSVALILDTSGSCEPQAQFYAAISQVAAELGNVEMYSAPNGELEMKYEPVWGWRWLSSEEMEKHRHGWQFSGRVILFFGDFDGGDYPVLASRKNKVYWFSSEDRYTDMDEHNWCSFTLKEFRGKYYMCLNSSDFLSLVKKVR